MTITTLKAGTTLVVRVEGELDLNTAGPFREKVDRALAGNPELKNIIFSLEGLTFIDSSGLGAILGRYRKVAELSGKVLACGLRPQVQKVFELSGLYKILTVCESEEQALGLV